MLKGASARVGQANTRTPGYQSNTNQVTNETNMKKGDTNENCNPHSFPESLPYVVPGS
jgi:hypothetical protein